MMRKPIFQREGVTLPRGNAQSAKGSSCLFVRHSNGTAISWISVAIARVVEIKDFFCKVKPPLLVKILSIVLTYHRLKFALPSSNDFMIRLYRRREIVWVIIALF